MFDLISAVTVRGRLVEARLIISERTEMRNGKRSMVDGPFAEAKEIVGGFFLLDCTREQALAAATECPAAEYATIEVREVGPCWDR